MTMLGKNGPLPLYQQLKSVIEDRIASGEWLPDTQVPSERELCEQFQISRITVRQALSELVMEGRLIRTQGRGTFVASARIAQQLTHLTGFTQDMQARGKRADSKVLQIEAIPAPPKVMRALQLQPGDRVVLLKRLRLADGEPMAIETAYLPDFLCHGLLDEKLDGRSLYKLLAKDYHIAPARAEQQMEAMACPAAEAKLLNTRRGAPVLHIHRTTFNRDGRPFEAVESFYRGDKYVFYAELESE
jgi:GntR family transcriptional regulator